MSNDLTDMLSAFSEERVEFLIVGAYAVGVHGLRRATGDLDIWVRPTPENAARVMAALGSFGAPLLDLTEKDLSTPEMVFQIGVEPGRIDILTGITGVAFDEAWPNRVEGLVAGREVHVIGRNDLIRNKRATGRTKDAADAEWLEKEPPPNP